MIGYERAELVNRELTGLIMRAVADHATGRSAA